MCDTTTDRRTGDPVVTSDCRRCECAMSRTTHTWRQDGRRWYCQHCGADK